MHGACAKYGVALYYMRRKDQYLQKEYMRVKICFVKRVADKLKYEFW
jgi:hypothetical protein